MNQPDDRKRRYRQYAMNLTLASVAGQVGCLTLIIVFVALFAGLWLDKFFDTKPTFTVLLLLGSVPVTLFLMFRIVMEATSHIRTEPPKTTEPVEEETSLGDHS